jgi:hypothetical protein
MNPPDHDEHAFTEWVRRIPRPVLVEPARQRSLEAALSALPTPSRFGPLKIHALGLAACWIIIACLWLSAPPSPKQSGAAPVSFQPQTFAPDSEISRLLASLYPDPEAGASPRILPPSF